MRRILILILSVIVIVACKNKKTDEIKLISIKVKLYSLESTGGCKDDTTTCARYNVEYPEINGLDATVTDSLKKAIAAAVDTGNPENDSLSFESAGRAFIADFEKTRSEFPDEAMGWYYNSKVLVNILSDTLISLEATNESFTGGAHGGYGTYFVNIDPNDGHVLTLNDLLESGYEEDLRKAGERSFRKLQKMSDSVSYGDLGYEFPNDKFKLNNNYGFTKDGITFVYNLYEISPYVIGTQTVEIPYSEIENWLK